MVSWSNLGLKKRPEPDAMHHNEKKHLNLLLSNYIRSSALIDYYSNSTNKTQFSSMKKAYDIAIIGSGIVGSSSALQLSRKGYKVLVLDSNRSPGFGTTSYSSSITRSCYTNYDSVKTAYEGYHHLKNWRDFVQLPKSEETAKLVDMKALLIKTPNSIDFINKTVPLMEKAGVPGEYLSYEETKKWMENMGGQINDVYKPRLISDENFGVPEANMKCEGGYLSHAAGYMNDPQLAARNMAEASSKFSSSKTPAEFKFGAKVVEILLSDSTEPQIAGLKLDNGEIIHAPIVMNAAGPYSSMINKMAFENNNIKHDTNVNCRVLRQEVVTVQAPEGVDFMKNKKARNALFDIDNGFYLRPEVSTNKFLIGSAEPDCDTLDYIESNNPDDINYNLSEESTTHIWRAALRFPNLPIPSSKNTQGIVSCYDASDDWTPIYDKSKIKGYYLAHGTSGNQFKNAGVIGKIMERIITGVENGHDHDKQALKLDLEYTFRGNYGKDAEENRINLGQFSRLREKGVGSNVMG